MEKTYTLRTTIQFNTFDYEELASNLRSTVEDYLGDNLPSAMYVDDTDKANLIDTILKDTIEWMNS